MALLNRHSALLMFCVVCLSAGTSPSAMSLKSAQQSAKQTSVFADTIYTNAKVYTVDDQQPWAEAVAIKGTQILAVGSNQSMSAHTGTATSVENLAGQMVLPGFVDSHAHPIAGGAYILTLALDSYAQPSAWLQAIEEYANANPDLPIIFGYGFLASSFGEHGPTKGMIDKVVSDRPVLIMDEGFHGGWANSKALEVLAITKDTPPLVPGFSYYKRDQNGEPTGYLLEATANKAMGDLEVITTESTIKGAAMLFEIMNSYGITAVFDAGVFDIGDVHLDILRQLDNDNAMTVRYVGSYMQASQSGVENAVDVVKALRQKTKDHKSPIRMLKIMNDGTIEGKTAAMFEDYQNQPGNKGETVFTQQQMDQLIGGSASNNIDVHIHALGERAIHETLNAIELAGKTYPYSDSRFTICHIQVIADSDMPRFAELDVIAQSTPLWASFDAQGKKFVSDDQFERYFRFNSLKELGVRLSFGSDFPASGAGTLGMSPIYNMEIGRTRQLTGEPNSPIQSKKSERLDIASLIRGYTLDAAYQLRMEDQIGSIEVGKKADLVILDKNLFETDPYTFSHVKVVKTLLDGQVVYAHQKITP